MSPARGSPPSVNDAAVARFRGDWEALTGTCPSAARRIGVAVSGGSDSMALLCLATAAFPGAVASGTVDHGLRREAAEEARVVARWCIAHDLPHQTLAPIGSIGVVNVQAAARDARYAALVTWAASAGVGWIATAHHRDDVAESFLLRAARGAGVAGLAEMSRLRASGRGTIEIVRPLLDWSRADLAMIAQAAGAPIADDPSNRDTRYDRPRIRALLAATPGLPPARLALTARNLRDAEDAIEWWLLDLVRERLADDDDGVTVDPRALPPEMQRRLIVRAIETVRRGSGVSSSWRESGADRLRRRLAVGQTGTIADVIGRVEDDRWRFRPAPPRRAHRSAE